VLLQKLLLFSKTIQPSFQTDYLLSRSRELKLRTRSDFETVFDDIKDLMSAQTLFAVDDALEQLEAVTVRVVQRRDELRSLSTR